jgi:hypothetical protein
MESKIWCACVITVLLVQTVAFGWVYETTSAEEGVMIGDCTYHKGLASDNGFHDGNYGRGSGAIYIYPTGSEQIIISYFLYAKTWVWLELWSGQTCSAIAYASGRVIAPDGDEINTAYSSVWDSGYRGEIVDDYSEEPDHAYGTASNISNPSEGIYAHHYASVSAWAPTLRDFATAWAMSAAWFYF